MYQLDLFFTSEELLFRDNVELKREMKKVREHSLTTKTSADKVRKALFARHNELNKRIEDLESRLKILERNICTNGNS